MSKEILVGLSGPAGCGKDTIAKLMVGYTPYALALPIKRALNSMYGWTMEMWDDRDWKERTIDWIGKSPRQMAQTLGTEWGRQHVCEDLWLRIGMQRWAGVRRSLSPRMVITDVRFDNEAQAIVEAGGTVWRVERENIEEIAGHVSERGVNTKWITGHVKNNGTLDTLAVVVAEWTKMLVRKYAR